MPSIQLQLRQANLITNGGIMPKNTKKLFEFDIYKEDTDPAIHQVAKLLLTSLGGWVA